MKIQSVVAFIGEIQKELKEWEDIRPCELKDWGNIRPWFRGESDSPQSPDHHRLGLPNDHSAPLRPKVARYKAIEETYLLQTFRRKAGGIGITPQRMYETDLWLFLAQHYGVPTRLLDWTEGALLGLFFSINQHRPSPRVYMLDPHRLNILATKGQSDGLNYPLTWTQPKRLAEGKIQIGEQNIALAWQKRNELREDLGLDLPIAVPATYQDHRMIAQRSCFTVHGKHLKPIPDLIRYALGNEGNDPSSSENIPGYLRKYEINSEYSSTILEELAVLGVTGSTIFPDLDHLARDIALELGHR